MYRIHYSQGNGYTCSCCGHWESEHEDFESEEEVIYWLSELEACKKKPESGAWRSLRDCRHVNEIVRIEPEDLTHQFKANPEIVAKLVKQREDAEAEKKRKEEKRQEELQRVRYEKLKRKYEGEEA